MFVECTNHRSSGYHWVSIDLLLVSVWNLLKQTVDYNMRFFLSKVWLAYSFFRKRGLKTPKYKFFFGNFFELRKNNVNL